MAKRVFKANPDLVEQIQTVNEIESAMRKKVEEQLPIFEKNAVCATGNIDSGRTNVEGKPGNAGNQGIVSRLYRYREDTKGFDRRN